MRQYIFYEPVRLVIPDFDGRTDDIFTQLDETYIFSAIISFTALWLEHYDELPLEKVKEELIRLSKEPIQVCTEKFFPDGYEAGRKNEPDDQ